MVTERNNASDQWRRARCGPWFPARTEIRHRPAMTFPNRVSPVSPRDVGAVDGDLPTLDYSSPIGTLGLSRTHVKTY